MAVMKDVQDSVAQLRNDVARNTEVKDSILTAVKGMGAMIASLKQQLMDAIAAEDPAALQAVVDDMATAHTQLAANAQSIADAALENTTSV